MKNDLEALARDKDAAFLEAKTGREELKRARKDWLRMKDDLEMERDAHSTLKEEHDQLTKLYKRHVQELQESHEALQLSLNEAKQLAEQRVPVEAIQGLKDQLAGASTEADAAKARVTELELELEALRGDAGSLTPRPTWEEFKEHNILVSSSRHCSNLALLIHDFQISHFYSHKRSRGLAAMHPDAVKLLSLCFAMQAKEGVRTQDLLYMVAARLNMTASTLEGSQRELAELGKRNRLLKAVLLPDPLPRAVQLSLVADSSSCKQRRGRKKYEGG